MNDYERQDDGGDRVPDHRVKWRMVLSWQTAKPLQCIKPNQKQVTSLLFPLPLFIFLFKFSIKKLFSNNACFSSLLVAVGNHTNKNHINQLKFLRKKNTRFYEICRCSHPFHQPTMKSPGTPLCGGMAGGGPADLARAPSVPPNISKKSGSLSHKN